MAGKHVTSDERGKTHTATKAVKHAITSPTDHEMFKGKNPARIVCLLRAVSKTILSNLHVILTMKPSLELV